jgi:hypothetical protein
MHDRPCGWLADGLREALPIVAPSASADTFRRSLGGRLCGPLHKEGRCMIAHADAWPMECAKLSSSALHPHRRTRSAAP